MSKKPNILYLVLCFFFTNADVLLGETVKITVSPDHINGKINPLIFGNNMIGYDPTILGNWTKYYVGYSNYGAGIWDPQNSHSVPEVIELAKEAGITIARFPGGSESDFYDWKKTIGSREKRSNFLYGLDEFMKTCEEINCEVVFTVNYFTGSPQDAADLVEYLNSPADGSNINGGEDWALVRAKNGHQAAYHIKYFELGNEVYGGIPQKGIRPADPEKYGKDYIDYRATMRKIDSTVLLGSVIKSWEFPRSPWNEKLFKTAGQAIDFLVEHTYRPYYTSNNEKVSPNKLFADALSSLTDVDKYYKNLSRQFEMTTGRKNIPIAVTEYNAGFVQDKPVPFRHSLGTALINAGLLQIFMKPENNILMANYWQFVNSYWGMIKNEKFMEGKGHYIKRPNYYVFEMFHKHFGNDLLDVTVSDADESPVVSESDNLLSNIKWQSGTISSANINVNKDEVEIYFDGSNDPNFFHVKKKVKVKPATAYHLAGYLRTEDLKDNEGVCLEIQDSRGWPKIRSNVTTERIRGTIDWAYVETEYTTLNDATEIQVIVRRLSGSGPVKGKVFVRNVELIEKPYGGARGKKDLSVSASRSKDGKTIYLMVLNKNVHEDVKATTLINDNILLKTVNVWTLNGPSIWVTNEKDPNTVNIKYKKVKIKNDKNISHIFPAHSLTSIEFKLGN